MQMDEVNMADITLDDIEEIIELFEKKNKRLDQFSNRLRNVITKIEDIERMVYFMDDRFSKLERAAQIEKHNEEKLLYQQRAFKRLLDYLGLADNDFVNDKIREIENHRLDSVLGRKRV